MWDMIKNWMKENQRKEQERYGGVADFVNRMQGEPTAHDNIDNEILSNTLNEIAYSSGPLGGQMLYDAKTRGGKKRYVTLESSSLPTKELRGIYYQSLLNEIKQNPQFADTTSSDLIPGLIQSMQQAETNRLQRAIDKIKGLF
jgi:hypothetical protein